MTASPGYDIDDTLVIRDPAQFKALGHALRRQILDELLVEPASIAMLADQTHTPKGTVNHHLKMLLAAGLVRQVLTRPVRGVTEILYGRTARTYEMDTPFQTGAVHAMFTAAANEWPVNDNGYASLRHARIAHTHRDSFERELRALVDRFANEPQENSQHRTGLLVAIYTTATHRNNDQPTG